MDWRGGDGSERLREHPPTHTQTQTERKCATERKTRTDAERGPEERKRDLSF